jgi:hypothetical protein
VHGGLHELAGPTPGSSEIDHRLCSIQCGGHPQRSSRSSKVCIVDIFLSKRRQNWKAKRRPVWVRLKLEVLAKRNIKLEVLVEISHVRRTCLGFHPFRRPKLMGVNIASF